MQKFLKETYPWIATHHPVVALPLMRIKTFWSYLTLIQYHLTLIKLQKKNPSDIVLQPRSKNLIQRKKNIEEFMSSSFPLKWQYKHWLRRHKIIKFPKPKSILSAVQWDAVWHQNETKYPETVMSCPLLLSFIHVQIETFITLSKYEDIQTLFSFLSNTLYRVMQKKYVNQYSHGMCIQAA